MHNARLLVRALFSSATGMGLAVNNLCADRGEKLLYHVFFKKPSKAPKKHQKSRRFFYLWGFSRIFVQKIVAFEHFTNAKKCDIMTRRSEKGACARRSILARSVNLMAPTRATDSYQPCIFGDTHSWATPKARRDESRLSVFSSLPLYFA